VEGLPECLAEAIAAGRVGAHAAANYLVALPRGNSREGRQLVERICTLDLTERQIQALCAHYRAASTATKGKIAEDPERFLKALEAASKGPQNPALSEAENRVFKQLELIGNVALGLTRNLPMVLGYDVGETARAALWPAWEKTAKRLALLEETVAALSEFVAHPLDPQYVEASLRQFRYPVPRRYAQLYEEVRSLNGRPPRHGGASANEGAEAVAAYLERGQAIDTRVAQAKAAWSAAVGMPEPKLLTYDQSGQALEETRAASEAYVATLSEAQAELGLLVPPPAFELYHELTRSAVDHERLAAQLMLHAAQTDGSEPNREALQGAITVWQRYCAPEPVTKAGGRRAREYERALRAKQHKATAIARS
jgi:hypothetical protein